jgi:hypothetical protein
MQNPDRGKSCASASVTSVTSVTVDDRHHGPNWGRVFSTGNNLLPVHFPPAFLIPNLRLFVKFADKKHRGKSSIKRDGPVFFSSAPVILAGDERTIMAIVAPMSRRSPGEGGSVSL